MKASELSHRLGLNALAVCRHYLSNGHKAGRYWLVGNVQNEKGKSLFVRLDGSGQGAGSGTHKAGKWTDAATGEHGDLLDVIQMSCGLPDLGSAMAEARTFLCEGGRFLGCASQSSPRPISKQPEATNYTDMAKRLYAVGRPLAGTLGEVYLNKRGITLCEGPGKSIQAALRFHACAWFDANTNRPAIFAGVRDNAGNLTGITRLFLDNKANLIERRALGCLNGNAVRIGPANPHRLLVGEGLESTLSFTQTNFGYDLADHSLAATLSAAHMAAFNIPPVVRYLTIAADNDAAGRGAAAKLQARAFKQGVKVRIICSKLADFNDDWVRGN